MESEVSTRLGVLARQLQEHRVEVRGQTLDHILHSAQILAEAKRLAGRRFGRWLREMGRMGRETAFRHLRVSEFVRENVALMQHFRTLSLTKLYALSTLPPALSRKCVLGEVPFSCPFAELSDVAFLREFAVRFPRRERSRKRHQVFMEMLSVFVRARKSMQRSSRYLHRLSESQVARLAHQLDLIIALAQDGRILSAKKPAHDLAPS